MSDDLTTTLELSAPAQALTRAERAYSRFAYEVRHPENHKQLVRFLVVGLSGYILDQVFFWLFLHAAGLDYKLSFCGAFICASGNNFFWNRHWTFKAHSEHPARQAVRFVFVQVMIAACAYLILIGLVAATNMWKVPANALAWIIVMPFSFVVQKLWSFKA